MKFGNGYCMCNLDHRFPSPAREILGSFYRIFNYAGYVPSPSDPFEFNFPVPRSYMCNKVNGSKYASECFTRGSAICNLSSEEWWSRCDGEKKKAFRAWAGW